MTRIASFHNYQSVGNDIMRQQVKLQQNHDQLASGKRLRTAGDDPVASIYAQNLSQQSTQINQYVDTINLAKSRLSNTELSLTSGEDLIDTAKRNVMKMINGSLASADRKAHRQDLQALFDDIINLANGKDESGNYLFSGTLASKQPFFRDGNNNVRYAGDSFHRMAQVAPVVEVQTSMPGDALFTQIPNPYGDYQPDYELQSGSLLLLSQALNSDSSDASTYQVTFSQNASGATRYELLQDGVVVDTGAYDPKSGVEWGSVKFTFAGESLPGDSVTLTRQQNFNLFDSLKLGIDMANESIFDASSTGKLHQVVEQLGGAFKHFNQARAEVGSRLNTLERQQEMHLDYQVVVKRSLSTVEDLNYATAVIDMNENMLALQASQQAFAKTKQLSLFNYI